MLKFSLFLPSPPLPPELHLTKQGTLKPSKLTTIHLANYPALLSLFYLYLFTWTLKPQYHIQRPVDTVRPLLKAKTLPFLLRIPATYNDQ